MAPRTEAACLLDTGALYSERVGFLPERGDSIFAGFKRAAFSLYFGDAPIFHFDLEGRWQRAFVGGIHYLKALDTKIQAIERIREGKNLVLRRRSLSFAEAADFDELVRATAIDLIDSLGGGRLERVDPPASATPLSSDSLRSFLERIARWDSAAWFAHLEEYLATYGPLPFLPPDCQNAVILQATLGHAHGRTFGGAPAAEYYVRTEKEFEEHMRAVLRLLGLRLSQCRGVFLGGSDVLRRPADEVVGYLEAIQGAFADDPDFSAGREVHAFLDDPSSPRPDSEALRRFKDLHLGRVSLGVESGDPSVRRLYGKEWANEDLAEAVADMKRVGMALSLVVLVGAGGVEHAEGHVEETARLITSLELGRGDIVALLDAEEVRNPRGAESSASASPGFTPLTGPRLTDQQDAIKKLLHPIRSARGVKVVSYSLEKHMV